MNTNEYIVQSQTTVHTLISTKVNITRWSRNGHGSRSAGMKALKWPPFNEEKDDFDAYLTRFEGVCVAFEVRPEHRSTQRSYSTPGPVSAWVGARLWTSKPRRRRTRQSGLLSLNHPSVGRRNWVPSESWGSKQAQWV